MGEAGGKKGVLNDTEWLGPARRDSRDMSGGNQDWVQEEHSF